MDENPRLFEIFLDIQSGLPRQGPGSNENTLKAHSFCSGLPKKPAILDIGCGPGMQTIALAKVANADITAVDINQEYLEELKEGAESAGVIDCIEILALDMNNLPFQQERFDLIWAEGSAYIMGFDKALENLKRFLKPEGYIAVSELVWLRPDPPNEIVEFFENQYPAIREIEDVLKSIKRSGYEITEHFTLPDSAWWDHYYTPLEAKLPDLNKKYSEDKEALRIINMTKREIEMRRLFIEWYGYEFFIAQKVA